MVHEITKIINGSWKEIAVYDEDGRSENEIINHQNEFLVEASCSCGETFNNVDALNEHINKIQQTLYAVIAIYSEDDKKFIEGPFNSKEDAEIAIQERHDYVGEPHQIVKLRPT